MTEKTENPRYHKNRYENGNQRDVDPPPAPFDRGVFRGSVLSQSLIYGLDIALHGSMTNLILEIGSRGRAETNYRFSSP